MRYMLSGELVLQVESRRGRTGLKYKGSGGDVVVWCQDLQVFLLDRGVTLCPVYMFEACEALMLSRVVCVRSRSTDDMLGAMDLLLSNLQSHIQKVLTGGGTGVVKRNKSRNTTRRRT